MTKLFTATLAASAVVLLAGSASADCFGHRDVTASAQAPRENVVAMSTYDGKLTDPATEEAQEPAKAAVSCVEGQKDCNPGTE